MIPTSISNHICSGRMVTESLMVERIVSLVGRPMTSNSVGCCATDKVVMMKSCIEIMINIELVQT